MVGMGPADTAHNLLKGVWGSLNFEPSESDLEAF